MTSFMIQPAPDGCCPSTMVLQPVCLVADPLAQQSRYGILMVEVTPDLIHPRVNSINLSMQLARLSVRKPTSTDRYPLHHHIEMSQVGPQKVLHDMCGVLDEESQPCSGDGCRINGLPVHPNLQH